MRALLATAASPPCTQQSLRPMHMQQTTRSMQCMPSPPCSFSICPSRLLQRPSIGAQSTVLCMQRLEDREGSQDNNAAPQRTTGSGNPALPMPAAGVGASLNCTMDHCAPIAPASGAGCALHGAPQPASETAAASAAASGKTIGS